MSFASPHQHFGILLVLIRSIGRRTLTKIWVGAERTAQGKDFEMILMVKVETTHPVESQFGSEFPAICNHCRVMTA